MGYLCDCSFSRLSFIVRTQTQTYADERFTLVGVSDNPKPDWSLDYQSGLQR